MQHIQGPNASRMSRDELPSQQHQQHQQQQQQQQQHEQQQQSRSHLDVASPADPKCIIKKEVLEEENHREEDEEDETTDISRLSKSVDRSTTDNSNSSDPKPNVESRSKDRISDNFEQFWMLVRPRVLSNLSLWDFLSDKTRFHSADVSSNDVSSNDASTNDPQKDVSKLNFLLEEVELLLGQVVDLITTCCSMSSDDNDANVVDIRGKFSNLLLLPFLNCDGRKGRQKFRLKSRSEIPIKFQTQLFEDVPTAEAEDLNDVSLHQFRGRGLKVFPL